MNPFAHEDALVQQIKHRLRDAGESVWQRYPLPWTHPSFKSCAKAAGNLLRLFAGARVFLIMRDACLAPVREAVLAQDRVLVIPSRHGNGLMEIPGRALVSNPMADRHGTHIDPPPPGSKPYVGPVDVVVVACLAFNRFERRLYTFELERTAYVLEQLRDAGRIPKSVPVVCVAAHQQEVTDWPASAQGYVRADVVVTPTRVIALGTGEEVGLDADMTEEVRAQEVQVVTADDDSERAWPGIQSEPAAVEACDDRVCGRGGRHAEEETMWANAQHGTGPKETRT